MRRPRLVALLLVLALLVAGLWRLWLPSSSPGYGYALVAAYQLVGGTPNTVMGVDGITLAVVILSRPLMWLFLGYAVAVAIGSGYLALSISLLVFVGLATVCAVAPRTAGLTLLGLTDVSMLGGIAFVLPGLFCVAAHFIAAKVLAAS